MSGHITIFNENYVDLLNDDASITVTDAVASDTGSDIVDFMRNRSLNSAWVTTDSTDAANTQLDITLGDSTGVSDILVIGHNLADFKIYTYNGATYDLRSTTTGETEDTTYVSFTEVDTTAVRIIIEATQTADEDKAIRRLIITTKVAEFTGYPTIKSPEVSTNKKKTKMLSGKVAVTEGVGSFSCTLSFDNYFIDDDLEIIEDIYAARKGLNFWFCGDDEDQFKYAFEGYRRKDVYLMRPIDDLSPEYVKGIYSAGIKTQIKLVETVR